MRLTDQQAEAVIMLLDSFCDFEPSCTSLPLEAIQKTRATRTDHPDQEQILNAKIDVKFGQTIANEGKAAEWMDITLSVLIQPELRPILVWRRMVKDARAGGEELPRPRTPNSGL